MPSYTIVVTPNMNGSRNVYYGGVQIGTLNSNGQYTGATIDSQGYVVPSSSSTPWSFTE